MNSFGLVLEKKNRQYINLNMFMQNSQIHKIIIISMCLTFIGIFLILLKFVYVHYLPYYFVLILNFYLPLYLPNTITQARINTDCEF